MRPRVRSPASPSLLLPLLSNNRQVNMSRPSIGLLKSRSRRSHCTGIEDARNARSETTAHWLWSCGLGFSPAGASPTSPCGRLPLCAQTPLSEGDPHPHSEARQHPAGSPAFLGAPEASPTNTRGTFPVRSAGLPAVSSRLSRTQIPTANGGVFAECGCWGGRHENLELTPQGDRWWRQH